MQKTFYVILRLIYNERNYQLLVEKSMHNGTTI